MKNQTNTTTESATALSAVEYKTHKNLNLNKIHNNKYYKRFFVKAISLIAIPIMTVSMIPCMAFADDLLIDNSSENKNATETVVDVNRTVSESQPNTHTISVNLSTIITEDPYQSILLNGEEENLSLNPELEESFIVYNAKAESVQYEKAGSKVASSESSQTQAKSNSKSTSTSTSTYRYANLVSITNDERYLAYCIIAGEVGPCSYRDKLLVAQSLYDGMVRCKLTPDHNGSSLSHVRSEYGYEGYKDFNEYKQECINCGVTYYEDIIKAVNEVFDNFNMPSQDFVLFFHSGYSSWHQNAKTIYLVEDTGAHKYYALKAAPEID